MNKIALLAVAYKRVESLKRLLGSLECAYYGDEHPSLIISIDKSSTDIVERYADGYYWPHGKKIVSKHEHNLGLKAHMMSLGKWFDCYDALVILEDDIIVSPNYYTYSRQTVEKYYNQEDIAGISLYSFALNYQSGNPFTPQHSEYDVYFMNCAMSWGEIWIKNQWQQFYSWYLMHQDFSAEPYLPERICGWEKSWLKYHTRYCIETNKYFVFPYIALSSNFGETGTHNASGRNNDYQVVLQGGVKLTYHLPAHIFDTAVYDGFFENKALYGSIGLPEDIICIDICGMKKNREQKRYWLSTKVLNYKVVNSYGTDYRPIETNVLKNNNGCTIFLYDTTVIEKNPVKDNNNVFLYYYYHNTGAYFIKRYGYKYLCRELLTSLVNTIKRLLK